MNSSRLIIFNSISFVWKFLLATIVSKNNLILPCSMAATALRSTQSTFFHRVMTKPAVQELSLQCSDGLTVAAQSWSTPNLTGSHPVDQANLGSEPNQRILCLHGWMDNCRSFHYLAPTIIQHYTSSLMNGEQQKSASSGSCQIVALDFPGHGLSSHKSLDGPPALLAESAFYVNEVLHQLNWDHESKPFTLIGHSMGAGIACLYAAAFPEQVEKLILLEGGT
jgi:pimeloyl-ACP methyl ester carboxylesterase